MGSPLVEAERTPVVAAASRAGAVPRIRLGENIAARPRSLALLGVGLALFVLALGPRWLARDTYVTADEDNWMRRAGGFAWGLANGRPGRTYQNGHPGVLTMELAILGQGPGGAERFGDPVTGNPRVVTAVPGFFEALVDARRAFALATAGFVGLFAVLLWRLLGPGPATLGALLLALDPFYLAHSQLVHLDAVLGATMTLALLCGLVRWCAGGCLGWVVAGGALSGLALLAKAPAAYLALAVPLLALGLVGRQGWRRLAADLGLWGAIGMAAFVTFWPSMWVNPLSTLERMVAFVRETGGQPHEQGSYFLGQQVVDPGPLFYLVAVPLRTTPLVLLGLVLLAGLAPVARRRLGDHAARALLAVALFALGFGLFMTLGAKKFDRYLVPDFPLLDLLAGAGCWLGWCFIRERAAIRTGAAALAGGVFVALAAAPTAAIYPYELAYYNPLLGGAPAAARLIPVGEGEGLREAALWLNSQPGAERLSVASHSYDALKANFVGSGDALRDRVPPGTDFVVLYEYQTQIGQSPQVLAEYAGRTPDYVVRLNGLDYVRIFRVPRRSAEVGAEAAA
jgi:hypothetical protein